MYDGYALINVGTSSQPPTSNPMTQTPTSPMTQPPSSLPTSPPNTQAPPITPSDPPTSPPATTLTTPPATTPTTPAARARCFPRQTGDQIVFTCAPETGSPAISIILYRVNSDRQMIGENMRILCSHSNKSFPTATTVCFEWLHNCWLFMISGETIVVI